MTWLAVPLGAAVGAILGVLGGGGAILTIPLLVYVLGQDPHAATTTSLVIVGISSAVAASRHGRRGAVDLRSALLLAALGALGTYAGSRASAMVAPRVLLVMLATLLVVVAALMLRKAPPASAETADPAATADIAATGNTASGSPRGEPSAAPRPRITHLMALAVALGALTGFFGVGGGFAIVPALVLILRFPMPVAVGTSLAVIALNSLTALLSRLGQGVSLDWPLVLTFTVSAIVGSVIGEYAARGADDTRLSRGFAVLLVTVAAYMLVDGVFLR